MQNWNVKTVFRLMAIVGVMAGMLTIFACTSDEEELPEAIPVIPPAPKVAAANTVVPINTTTVKALEGVTASLPAGAFATVPQLATQATTLRFTNTTAATPTATITAPNGTVTGTTTFGSCIFTVQTSTIPGIAAGQTFTVNPCEYTVATQGVIAGTAATTTLSLKLSAATSTGIPNQTVTVDATTGVVTVNNVNTGTSVTLITATGTSGG